MCILFQDVTILKYHNINFNTDNMIFFNNVSSSSIIYNFEFSIAQAGE